MSKKTDDILIGRAVRNRWNVTPQHRARALERMGEIIDDAHSTNREITHATKVLISMDQIDLASETVNQPEQITVQFIRPETIDENDVPAIPAPKSNEAIALLEEGAAKDVI